MRELTCGGGPKGSSAQLSLGPLLKSVHALQHHLHGFLPLLIVLEARVARYEIRVLPQTGSIVSGRLSAESGLPVRHDVHWAGSLAHLDIALVENVKFQLLFSDKARLVEAPFLLTGVPGHEEVWTDAKATLKYLEQRYSGMVHPGKSTTALDPSTVQVAGKVVLCSERE